MRRGQVQRKELFLQRGDRRWRRRAGAEPGANQASDHHQLQTDKGRPGRNPQGSCDRQKVLRAPYLSEADQPSQGIGIRCSDEEADPLIKPLQSGPLPITITALQRASSARPGLLQDTASSPLPHRFPPRPAAPTAPPPRSPLIACDARTGTVQTEDFDGPLELLLFLVRREGVDLRELRLAPITDAYLAQLELIETMNLELAGEFLVMAATLCFLKSRELLPRRPLLDETDEEELDAEAVRAALLRRLQEYERYKLASESLAARPRLDRDTFGRAPGAGIMVDQPVDPGTDAMGLLEVFYGVVQRHLTPPPVHQVRRAAYSLKQMAGWLMGRLHQGPRDLKDLLAEVDHVSNRVVAFLATLELARLQLVDVQQDHHLGPVVLRSRVEADHTDLSALSGSA